MESNADLPLLLRSSTSRLSPFAKPFALKRPSPPSSYLDQDILSSDNSAAPESRQRGYTDGGPDLTYYERFIHGTEFSGLNCGVGYAKSPFYGLSNDVGGMEKNAIDPTIDQVMGREGVKAWGEPKSLELDGTQNSQTRELVDTSEGVDQYKPRLPEQKVVDNPSLLKLGRQIAPITILRPQDLSYSTGNNISVELKMIDTDGGDAVDSSLKCNINVEEPDEDSPCWRGTMNSVKLPFVQPECAKTNSCGSPSGAKPTLNPMAPLFIPQNAERVLSLAWDGSFDFDEIHELGKEQSLGENTSSLHMLGSQVLPPLLLEENIISQEIIVTENDLREHSNDIEDASVAEAFRRISNYLSTSQSLNANLVVDTMHDFSEFLMRKYSGSHALSEPLLEKIQGIIQNLSMCSGERNSRRSLSPLKKSYAPTSKIPATEISQKAVVSATYNVGNVSNSRPEKADSPIVTRNVCEPGAFIGNIGAEIAQAACNASIASLGAEQGIFPQTLLYKTLWLQAMEELLSLKTKTEKIMNSGAEGTSARAL